MRGTCRVCGSDATANIHLAEPENHCKRPEEHHEFVAGEAGWDDDHSEA